jgi:hypothetical protein
VVGEEGLREVRDGFRPGQVRPADEPAQTPVAGRVAGQEDQMRPALALADPAQVLLDERPMAGQPGSRWAWTHGHAVHRAERLVPFSTDRSPALPPSPTGRPASGDDDSVGIGNGWIEQFDLDPDDRMEPDGLGRRDEPDDAVQTLVIRDGETAQSELERPLDEIIG